MHILHVDSSILGDHSVSQQISGEIVARLAGEGDTVIERDLGRTPLPHLDLSNLPSAHPLAQQEGIAAPDRAEGDAVLREFLEADVVVVGAPMYNFGISSQLKAWVDRILVPGTTFRYGANGPEGLAGGKRVVVAAARGGFYGQGAPAASFEHMESYLRTVFAFIGITDLEVIVAEGLSGGAEQRASAVARASAAARELKAA